MNKLKTICQTVWGALKRFFYRLGKAVKHFWRGLSRRMKTVTVMALSLVLLTATLLAVLLLLPEKEKEYESIDYLFPAVSRAYISEIELKPNGKDTYKIVQMANTASGSTSFMLQIGDVYYNWLTLEAETLSQLVVSAGQSMIYTEVISRPTDKDAFESEAEFQRAQENYDKRLVTYGLTEEKASVYVLRTVTGEEYTVYCGKKNHAGSGNYVRLAGKDTVYISATATMGTFLEGSPEQFVAGTALLPSSDNSLAYGYPRRFEVSTFLKGEDRSINAEDLLSLTCLVEGEEKTLHLNMAKASYATKQALLGKALGSHRGSPIPLTVVFTDKNGSSLGSLSVSVLSIEEAERLWFGARYLFPDERDTADKYGIYTFYAPQNITANRPDNGDLMTALENLLKLSGKVVHIGLNEAVMEEYGLRYQKILCEYPVFGDEAYERKKDESGNDVKDENGKYVYTDVIDPDYYLTGEIYVSAPKDGVCYVASSLYGVVAEIDISDIAFLYRGFFDLVSAYIFAGEIIAVKEIEFLWQYGSTAGLDGKTSTFEVTTELVTNEQGNESEQIAKVLARLDGGTKLLDVDSFTDFFVFFYYIRYAGENGLSDEEKQDLLANAESTVLDMTITLTDEETVRYRFVSYAPNKMAVFLSQSSTGAKNDAFYVYATDIKDLASLYLGLLAE